jgi:hypothetical protein
MAYTGGIRAGKAFVEVYADKTKLLSGLKSISTDLKAFGAGVSSLGTKFMLLGAGVVAPLLAAAKTFATVGSGLNDMAARTGVGTNALSELGFAAEQSGASLAAVEIGVKRMQKAITAAKDGPLAGLKGMAPEQQFMAIAESLAAIQDPTARAAKAMEIFGRGGTALIPMLGDVKALRAEAVRLGLSIGPEQAAAADALGDAWDATRASFKSAAVAIGSVLAPMLTGLAGRMKEGLAVVRQWVSEHKTLIITLFAVGIGAMAAGAGLFVLGKAITAIGVSLTIVKAATATFGFMTTAIGLLANPIVLLGVGIAALGAYFLYASGTGRQAASAISSAFSSLLSEVTGTFGVIAESMAAGDLVSAAKVGWALIGLEFQKGVAFLVSLWEWFKGTYDLIVSGLALGIINSSAAIQTIWADLCNWMEKTWNNLWASLSQNDIFANALSMMASAMGSEVSAESFKALGRIRFGGSSNAKVDEGTAAQKQKIEADRQAAAGAIGEDLAARQKKRDEAVKRSQDKVDAARAAWENAKGDAKAKAQEILAKAEADRQAAGGGIDLEAAGAGKTRGTFSGAAMAGLGVGGGFVKKMADGIDKLRKLNEDMLIEQRRLTLEMVA